jgi:hypothetical protein
MLFIIYLFIYLLIQASQEAAKIASAYNLRIREAGLKAQNHDKGLDGFIRKFDPGEDFAPLGHTEAKSIDVRIATESAISRLLPIHDGPDLWAHLEELSRSS